MVFNLMASISLFVQGHDHLEKKYLRRIQNLGKATDQELSMIGKILKAYATKKIKTITGNRREVRYNPKRTVTVSNNGAYPNHDRGKLVKGLRAYRSRSGVLQFQSRAPYALDLEFGTRNMAARPYMRRTLKANRKVIRALLAKGVKRAL